MPELNLQINGVDHRGWESATIIRSLDQFADAFELTLSERWADEVEPPTVRAGSPCQIYYGEELMISGYIDTVRPAYDGKSHTITVTGRSKAADLVDCASTGKVWRDRTLLQIAQELCQPFGIKVTAKAGVGAPFPRAEAEPGQPRYEVLEQLARKRAVRLVSTAQGNLLITTASGKHCGAVLELGVNIRKASGEFSVLKRFNTITVLGCRATEIWEGADAASLVYTLRGAAVDKLIRKGRDTVILAEGAVDTATCQRRAEWQRANGYGIGHGVTYTVSGWQYEQKLWPTNRLTTIRDPFMGIDNEEWLMAATTFTLDKEGERTELSLAPREAYLQDAEIKKVQRWIK